MQVDSVGQATPEAYARNADAAQTERAASRAADNDRTERAAQNAQAALPAQNGSDSSLGSQVDRLA